MTDLMTNDQVSLPPPVGEGATPKPARRPLPDFKILHQNVRYMTATSVTDSFRLSTMNPFIIRKVIDGATGGVEYVKKLASGDLLIKVKSADQVKSLLKLTQIHDKKVKVSVNQSLNTCKGVISCRDLKDMGETEIVEYMKDQDVVAARIITRLDDNIRVKTNSIILTFGRAKVPEKITVGYEIFSVRPYVPLPMRCFKCQKFGHGTNHCRSSKEFCGKCSGEHNSQDCKADPKCVNCGGAHTSFDRSCVKYKLEAEIISYKVKEDVSYPEARKHILSTSGKTPEPKVSYASRVVAKPQTCDNGCQTDFTATPKQTVSFTVSTVSTGTSTSETPTPSPTSSTSETPTPSPTSSTSESSTPPPPPPSTIVAEPTQQQKSKTIDNVGMTVLTRSNISHVVVPVCPTRNNSLERTTSSDNMDAETTTARGRTMSPAKTGGRRSSWSPKNKKQKNNPGNSPRRRN